MSSPATHLSRPKRSVPAPSLLSLILLAFVNLTELIGQVSPRASSPLEETPFTVRGFSPQVESPDQRTLTLRRQSNWWTENLTLSPDFISRWRYSRERHRWGGLHAVGIDLHKIVSRGESDFGTVVLQPYLVHRHRSLFVPNHADGPTDWEIETHQLFFNWTSLARGQANLRVGHMLVPFGLEPFTDTHFTQRQLVSGFNLGAKMDWGVSINGELDHLDYEVALLRGSGMEYIDRGKNYSVAGRVGTPYQSNWSVGLSGFYGQTIDRARIRRYRSGGGLDSLGQGLMKRWRVGVDSTSIWGPFTFQQEISLGQDFEQDVVNGISDIIWTSRNEKIKAYAGATWLGQKSDASGWSEDIRVRVGIWWGINQHWSFSTEWSEDLQRYRGRPEDSVFSLQMRAHY